MFGLGFWEIAVVLIVALLVLGPEKLPKIARQLGRGVRELRRVAGEFQSALNNEVDDMDREKRFKEELTRDLSRVLPKEKLPGPVEGTRPADPPVEPQTKDAPPSDESAS